MSSDGEGLFGETFGGSLVGVSDSGEGCTVLGDGRVHGKAAANASCCGEGGGKAAANASCGEGGGGGTGCRAGEEISLVGSVSVTSLHSFSFVEKVIRAALNKSRQQVAYWRIHGRILANMHRLHMLLRI